MNRILPTKGARLLRGLIVFLSVILCSTMAFAEIAGINGPNFDLEANAGRISTPDGASIYTWGFGDAGEGPAMQYPGPTLIVNQGDLVTVSLTNNLPVAVSIVFPGQDGVTVSAGDPGVPGLLTNEAVPGGGTVTYEFTASRPGTFLYQSGTEQDLQIEMGLFGTLIVRASGGSATDAYGLSEEDDDFDVEFLIVLSEMDITVHQLVEQGMGQWVDTTQFDPVYWFVNGRALPDTLESADASWLPNQPYNSIPTMHPGQKMLVRFVGAGRQVHPFHAHGNHTKILARDGRLIRREVLEADDEFVGPDLFTVDSVPGETLDGIFTWTGEKLGWDIYGDDNGHLCTDGDADDFDDATFEYCPDHDKPIPVTLPSLQSQAFGGFWSGSPYMGVAGSLPPGEGGLNPTSGFTYPWHSHNQKELVNNDIFPGGMMTFLIITPW